MEFNEELKKQAKEIFSLYAKHSPSGYAITEEDFIWTLAEYDSRQSKVSRVELPVKPESEITLRGKKIDVEKLMKFIQENY